jgi:hypothetical protein
MSRGFSSRYGLLARSLAVVCGLLATPLAAPAISNNFFVLPPSPDGAPVYSPRNGLNVEIDDRWFDGAGYRPLRLRFSTATPAAVERRIGVRLIFSDSGRVGDNDLIVTQSVVMPAGDDHLEVVVRCPAVFVWSSVALEISIDGKIDTALSSPGFVPAQNVTTGQGPLLRIATPSHFQYRVESGLQDARQVTSIEVSGRRRQITERLVCEPMASWLDYSGAEVISLDLATLRLLAERPEDEVAALRRWLIAGGVLWVENAGGTPSVYAEIEALLDVSRWRMTSTDEAIEEDEALPQETPPAVTGEESEAATPPGETEEGRPRKGMLTPVTGAPGWGYVKLDIEPAQNDGADPFGDLLLNTLIKSGDPNTRGWFAQRDVGFGRILAFNKLPFDVPTQLQFGRSRSVFGAWQNHRWANRHGLEPGSGNAEFGNLMIPGVGLAPVNAFQVLITLFVLVIGPLNYWLLWRRQQLHLLVVTTPLVALVATLGLASYASVADGFGVKARAHSVTLLDQNTGEAATWGRVSHYIATTPDELPSIPGDTAIYSIDPVWEAAFANPDADLAIAWEGDRQVLRSGWMPSRTAVQHLLVRSHKTNKRLELTGQGADLRLANRLGAPLELVVIRNEEGEWLMAENVDSDGAVVLKPVERLAAMQAFRTIAISRMPSFPAGAGRAVEDTLERVGGAPRDIRRMQRGMVETSLSENAQARVLDALTGLDGGRSIDVPPRSYIAVASQTIDTPLGWEEVEELDSFHVVVGRW